MRSEQLYLLDMLEAADELERLVSGLDFAAFVSSDAVRSAALWKLAVIGEAAGHVSHGVRESSPQIPWRRIVAFRNVLIHEYFGIDWEIAWQAVVREVPALRRQVGILLEREFPDSSGRQ